MAGVYAYSGAFLPATLAKAEAVASEFSAVAAGFSILAIQGVDSGAANAYVVTTSGGPSGVYADGNIVEFKAANANTGACTINVNGLGAVSLTGPGGSSLTAGAITAGTWYRALYNSTYSAFTLIAPITLVTTSNTISAAAPTHLVGLVPAGGVSTACAPIDATYAIDQSIAPTWTGAHTFANTVTFNSAVSFAGGLMLTGGSNQYAATLTGSNRAGSSLGLEVNAGTNVSDIAFLVNSQNAATQFFEIDGVGGVTVGAPTGGAQGVGTINAAGLYVNGSAVITTAVSSADPSAVIGLAAVNGTALTFMTSDSAPALSQAIAPTWTGAHTFTPSSTVTAATINAAVNAVGLNVVGGTNTGLHYLVTFATAQGSGFSGGLLLQAGTTSNDNALLIQNAAVTATYAQIKGDGSGSIGYNGSAATIQFAAAGNVTIPAATGGNTLTVSGAPVSGGLAALFQGANVAGAQGVKIYGGTTNSADDALVVNDAANSLNLLTLQNTPQLKVRGPVAGALVDLTPDASKTNLVVTSVGTSTAFWSRNGNQVTMCLGTATTTIAFLGLTALTVTGVPASLIPTRTQSVSFPNANTLVNGTATAAGSVLVQSNGTFQIGNTFGTNTTGATTGIVAPFSFSYLLN